MLSIMDLKKKSRYNSEKDMILIVEVCITIYHNEDLDAKLSLNLNDSHVFTATLFWYDCLYIVLTV